MQVSQQSSSFSFPLLSGFADRIGRGFAAIGNAFQQDAARRTAEGEAQSARARGSFQAATGRLKGIGQQSKKAINELAEAATQMAAAIHTQASTLQEQAKSGTKKLHEAFAETAKKGHKILPKTAVAVSRKTQQAASGFISTVIEIGKEFQKAAKKAHVQTQQKLREQATSLLKAAPAHIIKQLGVALSHKTTRDEIEKELHAQQEATKQIHLTSVVGRVVAILVSEHASGLVSLIMKNVDPALKSSIEPHRELLQKIIEINLLKISNNFYTSPNKISNLRDLLRALEKSKSLDEVRARLSTYMLQSMKIMFPNDAKDLYLPLELALQKITTTKNAKSSDFQSGVKAPKHAAGIFLANTLFSFIHQEIQKPATMDRVLKDLVVAQKCIEHSASLIIQPPEKVSGLTTFFQWVGHLFAQLLVICFFSATNLDISWRHAVENLHFLQNKELQVSKADSSERQQAVKQHPQIVKIKKTVQ